MAYQERECSECGAMFTPHQYNQKRCVACIAKTDKRFDINKLNQVCKGCGETFRRSSPQQFFCTPECRKGNYHFIETYGITRKSFDMMKAEQGGKCAVCGEDGFKINEHVVDELVVDHDHETGGIRGLLCHNCNRALGLFQDKESNLVNAIVYLRKRATTIPEGSTPEQVEAWSKGKKRS